MIEIRGSDLILKPHPAQWKVLQSNKRVVLALGGTQGGKTVIGPYWLHREIISRGPGDYLVVAPHIVILDYKSIPEFLRLFEDYLGLGKLIRGNYIYFKFSQAGMLKTFGERVKIVENDVERVVDTRTLPPTRVFFGHAKNPNTLEAATAKAAWLDEAGQDDFKLSSWFAVRRRLSIYEGRILITTTPYNFGWLYKRIYKPWESAGGEHPEIEVVQFESILNPAFPKSEWERAKQDLPPWQFDLFYRARFTRPAGLVYDCFGEKCLVDVETVPEGAKIFFGMDFGGTNTAAVFAYLDPESLSLVVYDVYEGSRLSASGHVERMRRYWDKYTNERPIGWGGAGSEGQFRTEMALAGLPVLEPDPTGPGSLAIGVSRVWSALNDGSLRISKSCRSLIGDLESYAYALDENGEPIPDKIENKEKYHRLDALRYLVSSFFSPTGQAGLRSVRFQHGPSTRKIRPIRRSIRNLSRGKRRFRRSAIDTTLPPMFRSDE